MPSTQPGAAFTQLLLLAAFIIPVIFFLLLQQNTLKAIQPANRRMRPGEVWLQLIPLFGFVWQFFVSVRVAASIKNELNARNAGSVTNLPTRDAGLSFCISACLMLAPFLRTVFSLIFILCWVLYWIELARYKAKIRAILT